MYRYTTSEQSRTVDHAGHIWEEWRAYVCDTTDAPSYVTGASSGLCCHTCELIIVDVTPDELAEWERSLIGDPDPCAAVREAENREQWAREDAASAAGAEEYGWDRDPVSGRYLTPDGS